MARRPTLDAECVTCHAHLPERDSICLATKECLETYVAYCVKHSPGMAKAEASDPDGFRDTILRNHNQKGTTAMSPTKKAPSKARAPKAEKAPTYCRFSGEQTGGGKFLPGGDAKLHGVLIRMSQAGDSEALTELLAYSWRMPDGIDPGVEKEARAALKGLDLAAFQIERAEARIKEFHDGATLEDVYGQFLKRQPKPRKAKAEAAPVKAAAKKAAGRPRKAKASAA